MLGYEFLKNISSQSHYRFNLSSILLIVQESGYMNFLNQWFPKLSVVIISKDSLVLRMI